MARVTYGESITEYAGSIGGITYQKNASGNIARLRPNPTVNPTALQANYQTNMAYLVSFWPTLSQEDKKAWNDLAAAHKHTTPWGVEKTLSGYQWFLSVNLNLLNWPTGIRSTPAEWYAPPPPDQFTIVASLSYIHITWDPAYVPAHSLQVYCSLPLRQSSLKLRRSLFFLSHLYEPGSLPLINLTAPIEALFNVDWIDFRASANCSIIIRLTHGIHTYGYWSTYTSAIIKID
jgi:hypothetical protein